MNQSYLPPISILTPTYMRSKFLPLLVHNLKNQSYPHNKLEICIYDDSPLDQDLCDYETLKELVKPIKVVYHREYVKKTIGEKRNYLVKKLATSKILIFMDDDDIYHNDYVMYSYNMLKTKKAGLVGSNGMLFTYPEKGFKMTGIKCKELHQIHEATMCFTKKYFVSMGGFRKCSQGEGTSMVQTQKKNVAETDIHNVMICVAHDGNTVDKQQFDKEDTDVNAQYAGDKKDILREIFNLK